MNRTTNESLILQILFCILGFAIITTSIIKYMNVKNKSIDFKYISTSFYQQIICKSNGTINEVMSSNQDDDENDNDFFSLSVKSFTDIDIKNPKTYIASQIPILRFMNINVTDEDRNPVVVIPNNQNQLPKGNKTSKEEPNNSGSKSKPTIIKPIKNPKPSSKVLNPIKPLILIYHTHTTEAYNNLKEESGKKYSSNLNITVCQVGEVIKKELEEKYGISTIHDMTIHDATLNKAYDRSRVTVSKYLKKYPSIRIVIDVHRDGAVTRNSVLAFMNNDRYSRVMFVAASNYKNYKNHLGLAKNLTAQFNKYYPKLCKPILFKGKNRLKYNQDLSSKNVLIEIGANNSTLDEADKTAKIFARILAQSLK